MMKKNVLAAALLIFSVAAFAYNPPAGGQNLFRLTSPWGISGAGSSAGGGIFSVTPSSAIINPALTAFEQRPAVSAAGTLFHDNDDSDHSLGGAAEGGLLIPTRWGVGSFLFQGIWANSDSMNLGNNFHLSGNFSKDVTDKVSFGIGGDFGYLRYHGDGRFFGAGNLGFFYNLGDISVLKNFRIGAAVTNLGKVYGRTELYGIDDGDEALNWPGLATFRTGAAASIIDMENFNLGFSADVAFPTFQNVVADTGLQILIARALKISTSWQFDMREFKNHAKNLMPSVGLSYRFAFHSNKGSVLADNGWAESEMTVATAWQRMYKHVDAYSGGVILNLGLKDSDAPEVRMWGEK